MTMILHAAASKASADFSQLVSFFSSFSFWGKGRGMTEATHITVESLNITEEYDQENIT